MRDQGHKSLLGAPGLSGIRSHPSAVCHQRENELFPSSASWFHLSPLGTALRSADKVLDKSYGG